MYIVSTNFPMTISKFIKPQLDKLSVYTNISVQESLNEISVYKCKLYIWNSPIVYVHNIAIFIHIYKSGFLMRNNVRVLFW